MGSKNLVNPIALNQCRARFESFEASILDISFVRVVVEDNPSFPFSEEGSLSLMFDLDRHHFEGLTRLEGRGEGWVRLELMRLVPSSMAHLRSFLSPKKVGESIVEDWNQDGVRHFHGLNESELWFDSGGGILFSYLDPVDPTFQFMTRIRENKSPLRVGRLLRQQYIGLSHWDTEPPLLALSEKEVYPRLGECRDIVTNFRPTGPAEYGLKQRLLKVISDYLYSHSHKFEYSQPRPRTVSTSSVE